MINGDITQVAFVQSEKAGQRMHSAAMFQVSHHGDLQKNDHNIDEIEFLKGEVQKMQESDREPVDSSNFFSNGEDIQ